MKISAKLLPIISAAVIVAACLLPIRSVGISSYAAETDGRLSYDYIMSSPIAVAADGNELYVLTERGRVAEISDGIEYITDGSGAKGLAVSDGKIYTDKYDGFVFAGSVAGEVARDAVYIYGDEDRTFVTPTQGAEFTGGTAHGDTLYVAERTDGRTSVYAYDLSDGDKPRTLIRREIRTDGDITAMAYVESEDTIYYATSYSLYRIGRTRGFEVGGITSLASDGEKLYFTTRSGKVCTFSPEGNTTVLCAAEKISVAARGDFAAFADYGNDRVEIIGESASYQTVTEQPAGIAIGYDGTVFVASYDRVLIYDKTLAKTGEITFENNVEYFGEIKVDLSDITGNAIYAVTDEGRLLSTATDNILAGVKSVETTSRGDIYVMMDDGSVRRYDKSLSAFDAVLGAGEFTDLAADNAGNVFRSAADGIYANDDATPFYEKSDISEIALSMTKMTGHSSVGFGDIISVSSQSCSNEIIPRSVSGADMADNPDDYASFVNSVNTSQPNFSSYTPDYRLTTAVTGIYGVPTEMPSTVGLSAARGVNVIVLGKYAGTDYYYALVDTSPRITYGFVNAKNLSDTRPLENLYAEDLCMPVSSAPIYKFPTVDSPHLGTATLGSSHAILPFVRDYKDSNGQVWCRIAFTIGDNTYAGYVLRTSVAINGSTGGEHKQIVPDAVIRSDGKEVETYYAADESAKLGTVADGTPVQLEEAFLHSNEFTKITYISDEETGATTTCYVKTEYLKHTEAGWYQVIMFIVAAAVIVAIAIIIIIAVRRKRKIDR